MDNNIYHTLYLGYINRELSSHLSFPFDFGQMPGELSVPQVIIFGNRADVYARFNG